MARHTGGSTNMVKIWSADSAETAAEVAALALPAVSIDDAAHLSRVELHHFLHLVCCAKFGALHVDDWRCYFHH